MKLTTAFMLIVIVALGAFATPADPPLIAATHVGAEAKLIRDAHEKNIRYKLEPSTGNLLTDMLKEPLTLGLMRTETFDSQDITKLAIDAGIFTLEEAQNDTVTRKQIAEAWNYARFVQFEHNPGLMGVIANTAPVLATAINWNDMNTIQKAVSLVRDAAAIAFAARRRLRAKRG